MSELRVSIDVLAEQNFGDHGAVIRTSHEYLPDETVEELVRRVFTKLAAPYASHNPGDWIELRVQVGADGETTGETPRPQPKGAPF